MHIRLPFRLGQQCQRMGALREFRRRRADRRHDARQVLGPRPMDQTQFILDQCAVSRIDGADGDGAQLHLAGPQHQHIGPMPHIGLEILFQSLQPACEIAVRFARLPARKIVQIGRQFSAASGLGIEIIMGQQPGGAIIAVAIRAIEPIGGLREKLLERIRLAQHQSGDARHRHLREADGPVLGKIDDRKIFREPFHIPGRIRSGKIV